MVYDFSTCDSDSHNLKFHRHTHTHTNTHTHTHTYTYTYTRTTNLMKTKFVATQIPKNAHYFCCRINNSLKMASIPASSRG